MTYYICIVTTPSLQGPTSIATFCHGAILNHASLVNLNQNLVNEPMHFMAIDSAKGLEKISFEPGALIKLCVGKDSSRYSPTLVFNMEHFRIVSEIYDKILELKLKVDPNVVYV
jgi:hypothetical protein